MRKIIALGAAAISAATMVFGAVSPASAVDATTLTDAVCDALPDQVTGLADQLTAILTGITSGTTDLDAKKAALDVAVSEMADAVVAHIQTVTAGGNVGASGQVLAGKLAIFADKLAAANNSATAWFEAQRGKYLTEVASGYVSDVQSQLCSA